MMVVLGRLHSNSHVRAQVGPEGAEDAAVDR